MRCALALELEHAVDGVLEHARARERAVLGDVADEDHGAVPSSRAKPLEPRGDLAHLADAAGRAGQRLGVERLHRVDHADSGPLGLERGEHRLERRLGEHGHGERVRRRGARPAA